MNEAVQSRHVSLSSFDLHNSNNLYNFNAPMIFITLKIDFLLTHKVLGFLNSLSCTASWIPCYWKTIPYTFILSFLEFQFSMCETKIFIDTFSSSHAQVSVAYFFLLLFI